MFFSLMWFSGCRFSTAAIQPSSARQLPILAALNEENPTLSLPIITEPCALFNTFLSINFYFFEVFAPPTALVRLLFTRIYVMLWWNGRHLRLRI